jgi:hypothetical protein
MEANLTDSIEISMVGSLCSALLSCKNFIIYYWFELCKGVLSGTGRQIFRVKTQSYVLIQNSQNHPNKIYRSSTKYNTYY